MSWNVDEINDNALRLICVDGLGGATLSKLVVAAGGINEAGDALKSGQATRWLPRGASEMLRERMLRMDVEPARWSAEAIAAKIVLVTDDDFPQLLSPLPACPAALWYRGSLECLSLASVGIVGSRRCTTYGIEQAALFSKEIVQSDLTVISGGARGIDAVAHRTAMQYEGSTAVVLGSGLSVVYPPEHATLFDSIVRENGVILSEFPCHRSPRPAYFPRRNRIVSGLSSVVLVVEAARRSGALITARIAVEEHGRQVFAVPGRLGDSTSEGCLQCMRDGWAGVAIQPADIIEEAVSAWARLSNNFAVHQ
ncbi:MAG: DNA-protecting protein DprA [Phycisphaerae bacterium]|jgi:DNA processing protein|nr:DNA-protecting protein DprA [Phycisphaerae bacterium]MBT6269032.1 DNA-protecting protein DprA [Phycisphaerae bacterium]MBT6283059.1 DNA-protecting protein DprA [Phycisphaerae bacterium]